MSYVIKCDNDVLYNQYIDDRYLASSDFSQADNEFGSISFSLYDDHPLYNYIVPKKSRIKIYKNGQLKWIGRAVEQEDTIRNERFVYCEGCIAYLKDSIMRPFTFEGSPAQLFEEVITQHNEQVSEDQQLIVGNCTVTDPNDTIVRSSVYYLSSWDVFREKLLNLGGHLGVTFDQNEHPILNWYAEIQDYTTQKIKFGENLVDFEKKLLYEDFYTACIPLGAKDENDIRLTIASVNEGADYLVNEQLAEQYGMFFAPTSMTTWDDVAIATNLRSKGLAWLSEVGVKYKDKVELSAEDISFLYGGNVSDFDFLQNVEFVTHDGVALDYLIADFSVDPRDPYSVSIVLSKEEAKYAKSSFTDLANRMNESSSEQIKNVEAQAVSKTNVETIVNTVISQSTYIVQKANEIVMGALAEYSESSDMRTLINTLQSQLELLANGMSLNFSMVETLINNQGAIINEQGQLINASFSKYDSWFRFIAQSATTNAGLVIGQSGSPIQVKIENDVMYFCTDPDNVTKETAIAYFAAGQMHVNFANVNNLAVGFVGRWLDVRIVGSGDNTCALFSGRLS